MRFFFLVNDATQLEAKQTTTMLIAAAAEQGHEVLISGVKDLSYSTEGAPLFRTRRIRKGSKSSRKKLIRAIVKGKINGVTPGPADVVMIRTNPARDISNKSAHMLALNAAAWCHEKGCRVFNHPRGLVKASSKLYLLSLPASVRPKTIVSHQSEEINLFIERLGGPAVLKPLQGTRGNDVFFVPSTQGNNYNQIIDVLLRQGPVMVQEYLPEAEKGDTRVVVLNGEILQKDGKTASVQRVPGKGELRSNIHAGGSAQPGIISAPIEEAVKLIGPKLVQDGLFLVGLDFIGGKIIEANVFSTGGLRDAERFTEVLFAQHVIEEITSLRC